MRLSFCEADKPQRYEATCHKSLKMVKKDRERE